ncbi:MULTISPECIES: hypothetical protein [Halomonas]|jgi:hypothetical protein|nr:MULTISPECIES: hypothetical protein [Halomonas]MCO7217878.1 hypothetical protein [Halomonas sp. OfavH-34-E]
MRALILITALALAGCSSQPIDREFGHRHGYDAMRSMIQSTGAIHHGVD